MRRLGAFAVVVMLAIVPLGCAQTSVIGMQDGYYSAEAAHEDAYGWKEFVTIYVKEGKIVTVEYNAKNSSGLIKSWDIRYMRNMNAVNHTYPNKYTRQYGSDLLNKQNPDEVDAISGATHSYTSFQMLARAAIHQAEEGDTDVAYVELSVGE